MSSSSSSASAAASSSGVTAPSSTSESLSTTFYRLQRRATQSSRDSTEAASLLAELTQLAERIQRGSYFSTNEELEDLSTQSMKYMLVPYYLGQLETTYPCAMNERLTHITRGLQSYQAFVSLLQQYKLAKDADEVKQFELAVKTYQVKLKLGASAPPARRTQPADPYAARNAKIARFKREKELTTQLEAMTQSRKSQWKKNRTNVVGASAQGESDEADEEALDSNCDDEDVRAFYQLLFQSLLLSAVDAAKSAADEIDILIHHRDVESRKPASQQLANMSITERQQAMTQSGSNTKPVMYKMTPDSLNQPIPEHMKHIMQGVQQPAAASSSSSSAVPQLAAASSSSVKPSTVATQIDQLIATRANARADTFKLTNQPTYSIEQWAEQEIAAGRLAGPDNSPPPKPIDERRIRSAANREIAEEMVEEFKRTQLEDDDEAGLGHEDGAAGRAQDEIKTMKDREWDNWKDDHQKGVGNSIK